MATLQGIKQRYGIIGRSPLLERALDTATRVASTDLTVLITGESGVGKEVFSKIIHSLSPRKHNNFIAINCGAIPSGTINSELFGHEKGAFTGASTERKGYFETVDKGTIFLDEIGEMPMDTQSFLLRILESGEYMKVGSSKVLKTDIRIVAATNVDLKEKIKQGKFREDLYYRLNTVPIKIPSLKERREDVPVLFRKFAMDIAEKYHIEPIRLDEQATMLLQNYPWPGNIRELKNVAEQVSVLSEDRRMDAEQLLDYLPNIANRNLPALAGNGGGNAGADFQEREILYKLLFEMKADMNDLKQLVYGLIQNNNLDVPDKQALGALMPPKQAYPEYPSHKQVETGAEYIDPRFSGNYNEPNAQNGPVIINNGTSFNPVEEVEESLSLVDMEKEMIQKALKKHNGRRKDAAKDLEISERTLYRKIKEYGLL